MSKRSIASILALNIFTVIAIASSSPKELARRADSLDPEKDYEEIQVIKGAYGIAQIGDAIVKKALED